MNYHPDAEDLYRRLAYRIMDIREAKKIKVRDLCDMADVSERNYGVLIYRNTRRECSVNANIKALLALIDALGSEIVLQEKGAKK